MDVLVKIGQKKGKRLSLPLMNEKDYFLHFAGANVSALLDAASLSLAGSFAALLSFFLGMGAAAVVLGAFD